MNILTFLRPSKLALASFIVIGLLSSIKPYGIEATTKITWDEYHGTPFTFIQLSSCSGPCGADRIIQTYTIQGINIYALTLNIIIWYVIAGLIVYGFSFIFRNKKIKAIVTGRR